MKKRCNFSFQSARRPALHVRTANHNDPGQSIYHVILRAAGAEGAS